MAKPAPRPLHVIFFRTKTGNEPVREWLFELTTNDRKSIGADILAVQWAWPVGKPLVDSLGGGLWEVRSSFGDRIARVLFHHRERGNHSFTRHGQKVPDRAKTGTRSRPQTPIALSQINSINR